MRTVLVAGGGGAIGGHLTARLLEEGNEVIVVDIKPREEWWQVHGDAENHARVNLADLASCRKFTEDVHDVYMLAADMGGMGFIENNKARCMLSVLPSTHMLLASAEGPVERYFYASSACVYAAGHQDTADVIPLAEHHAYPAEPEDGYGWEKLFSERMCRHFWEDFGLETRVARYHNVYGPYGTWIGGREKAPAAICRKVADAVIDGHGYLEIWGDGEQTRSFMYVDDCVQGTRLLMDSSYRSPVNIGTHELVTINQLADVVEEIAGTKLERRYNLDAPQGVRGRNSDNTLVKSVLGWEPSIPLRDGLERTYRWIYDQIKAGA